VSELDYETETSERETAEADASQEPLGDTGSREEYETGEPAHRGYREYTETDAEVEARIADQDELPPREESRQSAGADDLGNYDMTDLGAEYDGDIDAFLAEQDELPPRQEYHASLHDQPNYHDETNLTSGYDGDLGALTTEEEDPATPQESRTAT
jgi:hypothetical protein